MIKFFAIYALILIALAVFSVKKNTVQKVFFYLHLIGGMLLAVFGFFHGIGHFSAAPFQMQLTGGVMLLLLIVELFLGSRIYKNETST